MLLQIGANRTGRSDLYNFVLAKILKTLSDLVSTTWKLEKAPVELEKQTKSRYSIIQELNSTGTCIEGCGGKWFRNAHQVLVNNHINLYYFDCALRHALKKGRQKNVNILIVGLIVRQVLFVESVRNNFQSICEPSDRKVCLDRP